MSLSGNRVSGDIVTALLDQINERDAQISTLQQTVAAMQKKIESLSSESAPIEGVAEQTGLD